MPTRRPPRGPASGPGPSSSAGAGAVGSSTVMRALSTRAVYGFAALGLLVWGCGHTQTYVRAAAAQRSLRRGRHADPAAPDRMAGAALPLAPLPHHHGRPRAQHTG